MASTLRSYGNNTMRERGVHIAILGVDIAILRVDIAILGVHIAILGVDIAIPGVDIAILDVTSQRGRWRPQKWPGPGGCVAAKTAKVAGLAEAGGCVAAGTTKVARLAVGGGIARSVLAQFHRCVVGVRERGRNRRVDRGQGSDGHYRTIVQRRLGEGAGGVRCGLHWGQGPWRR